MVYTKTYIFKHFYEQYLVRLTVVLRNSPLLIVDAYAFHFTHRTVLATRRHPATTFLETLYLD